MQNFKETQDICLTSRCLPQILITVEAVTYVHDSVTFLPPGVQLTPCEVRLVSGLLLRNRVVKEEGVGNFPGVKPGRKHLGQVVKPTCLGTSGANILCPCSDVM